MVWEEFEKEEIFSLEAQFWFLHLLIATHPKQSKACEEDKVLKGMEKNIYEIHYVHLFT